MKISAFARRQRGFTLIELLVVILIIGILAAIAVPQYFKVVEKGKFSEIESFIGGLSQAQERYLARIGNYYTTSGALPGNDSTYPFDAYLGTMKYFSISGIGGGTAGNAPVYSVTATRASPCPAIYGCYTVTYTAPPGSLVCNDEGAKGTQCHADLIPQ